MIYSLVAVVQVLFVAPLRSIWCPLWRRYQAQFRVPIKGCQPVHSPSTERSRYRIQDVPHRWMNTAVRFYAPSSKYVKAFNLSFFDFLQLKILDIDEMVNILSARVLFLTHISAVLTYSSGLALCPRRRYGLNSAVQKCFRMSAV